MKVVLVGGEGAGAQALRLLQRSPVTIPFVVAAPDPDGRPGLATAARAAGFDPLPAGTLATEAMQQRFAATAPDLVLNVHSLARVPAALLPRARIGWFNLHPGLLPEYGGVASSSWALFEGAPEHGTTLHWIDATLDTGAIAYQTRFAIGEADTGGTLAMQALREGLRLLEHLLADAARDPAAIPRRMQEPSRVRRLGWTPPERGTIRWRWPAAKIARFVRACDYLPLRSPWPAPQAWLGDDAIGIARARDTGVAADAPPGSVRRGPDGQPWVAAGDHWLEVTRLGLHDGTAITFTDAAERLAPGMLLRETG